MKADILACWGSTWLDRVIKKVLGDNVTHVAIQVTETHIAETTWWECRVAPISVKNNNYHRLRCDQMTDTEREAVVNYILEHIHSKYDYKAFFAIGLNKLFGWNLKWNDPNKYLCVEEIMSAYMSVGYDLMPGRHPSDVKPNDLLNSPFLREVKETVA
jgi:hypothetical protein